jgi:DNA-binding transcriptional LysR family regulator
MDLEALKALVLIVDHGSVSRAAKQLQVSRATIRRRLSELEASVGVPLLRPAAQGVVPTDAGISLAERGRPVLSEVEAMLESVKASAEHPAGKLRLVAPVGMHPQAAIGITRMMRAMWPEVQLDVQHDERPASRLTNDVDLVLCFDLRPPEGPWEVIELPPMEERLYATRSHVERNGPFHSVEDLEPENLLVWRSPDCDPRLLPTFDGGHVAITPSIISTDLYHVHMLARSGMGIAYAPDAKLAGILDEPMVEILGERIGRQRPVRMLVPPVLSTTPKFESILQVLRSFSTQGRRAP